MEARLQPLQNPSSDQVAMEELTRKFSTSAERIGKVVIHPKQVKSWFCNRRYCSREAQEKSSALGVGTSHHLAGGGSCQRQCMCIAGNNSMDGSRYKFEAKSARDGAWYDVGYFVSPRISVSGVQFQEVMVKFSGFGVEEVEWVDARTCVRRRSFPFRASECEFVKLWHHVLCYKETPQGGRYFDAQVHARKVKAHGPEECVCTFLVRFEHDQSEDIVCLRKLCGRPETYELK